MDVFIGHDLHWKIISSLKRKFELRSGFYTHAEFNLKGLSYDRADLFFGDRHLLFSKTSVWKPKLEITDTESGKLIAKFDPASWSGGLSGFVSFPNSQKRFKIRIKWPLVTIETENGARVLFLQLGKVNSTMPVKFHETGLDDLSFAVLSALPVHLAILTGLR